MRFITEFKVSGEELKYTPNPVIDHRKSCAEDELGSDISKAFSFKELGTIEESGLAGMYQQLEIEAFPMDKWVDFKQKLYELFHKNGLILSGGVLEHMLKELESYGTKKEPL